jgi:hypothetical protein
MTFCGIRKLVFAAAIAFGGTLQGSVIVPGNLANTEGNLNSISPLSVGAGFYSPYITGRFQEIFDASQFSVFGTGQTITQVAFRGNSGNAPNGGLAILDDIEVRLSTSSKTPQTLSSTYADNANVDVTLVYSGPITFLRGYDAGTPRSFNYIIPLQAGFVYNPALGALLLDIRVIQGLDPSSQSPVPTFDYSTTTSSLSVVRSVSASSTGYSDPTGNVGNGRGYPVQLTYEPTAAPEPATLMMMGTGGTALLLAGFIRRRRRGL